MDALDPSNSLNIPEMADMTFAMDFLTRAKVGVRNMAVALTEAATPELRAFFRAQLFQGIAMHQEISELMVRKHWFHPYELKEQYRLDQLSARNTAELCRLNMFPGDSSRKGMFDRTPDEGLGGAQA